jgi:hypothetical protein
VSVFAQDRRLSTFRGIIALSPQNLHTRTINEPSLVWEPKVCRLSGTRKCWRGKGGDGLEDLQVVNEGGWAIGKIRALPSVFFLGLTPGGGDGLEDLQVVYE